MRLINKSDLDNTNILEVNNTVNFIIHMKFYLWYHFKVQVLED